MGPSRDFPAEQQWERCYGSPYDGPRPESLPTVKEQVERRPVPAMRREERHPEYDEADYVNWVPKTRFLPGRPRQEEAPQYSTKAPPLSVEGVMAPEAEKDGDSPGIGDGACPLSLEATRDRDYVFDTYLAFPHQPPAAEPGVTLMIHDVPYRFQVEPEMVDLLDDMGVLDSITYCYLPMTSEGYARSTLPTRNKGYCFLHFSDVAMVQKFEHAVANLSLENTAALSGKSMHSSMAKFQGVRMNLTELLDIRSKKWRPKHGLVYIRIGSKIKPVSLLALRTVLKMHHRRSPPAYASGIVPQRA